MSYFFHFFLINFFLIVIKSLDLGLVYYYNYFYFSNFFFDKIFLLNNVNTVIDSPFVEKIFFFSNQGYLSLSWSLQNVFTFINYRIFYFYFDNTNFTNLLTLSLVNNFFNIYIENLFTNLLFLFFFIFFFLFFSYSKKNNYKFI